MSMNKNLILISFLLFNTSQVNAQITCKDVFSEKKLSLNISKIIQKNENPFDVARKNRQKDTLLSNTILKDVENRLENEAVVKIENLGGGVNTSYKITFESGLMAAYKPVNPDRPNQPAREAIAYKLSKLLNLDIVPPTVVRELKGDIPNELKNISGSVQLFVHTAKPLKKGKLPNDEKILIYKEVTFDPDLSLSGRRLRIFDWLINNHDRGSNAGNYLVSNVDSYIIGIDHSVSFVGHDKAARSDKIPYYKSEFLNDVEFYNKLTSASREEIRKSLEGLNPVRIDEFFERYDKLIADFEKVLAH